MSNQFSPAWAWEAYKPSDDAPWNLQKVGHLYRRAGFGASWHELQAGVTAGCERTLDKLLQGGGDVAAFDEQTRPLAESIAKSNSNQQLRAWWLYRMLYTPHPLREKLTLFWHNHFATSNAKVLNAGHMLGQYRTMYRHAQGNFGTLLQEISKDPAMLVWLDTNQSKKGQPNENYARELMELFSLGIGHYTETDIREAARAFTGWELRNGAAYFNRAEHDDTPKTVLGRTGQWHGPDIVRICLDQPACAGFIVTKLFRFLISEALPTTPELLEPLIVRFRDSNYDFGQLVETMLRSNLFFSPHAYRTKIKSPVEFALGIVRALEGQIGTTALAGALESLGQNVFNPPSVKGWDGGQTWLNGQTLLFRQNLALALTSTEDPRFNQRTDPVRVVQKHAGSGLQALDFLLQLFLQGGIPAETREQLQTYFDGAKKLPKPIYWSAADKDQQRVRALAHLILSVPEYQLN
jgi:uncharacterized protein (DUF1800 family)